MTPREFVSRLKHVAKTPKGWTARCPAHDDHNNSLSVDEGQDARILLKCFAGCTSEEIVRALGLTMASLFADSASGKDSEQTTRTPATVEALAQVKKLPVEFLRDEIGLKNQSNGVTIPYRLIDGSPAPRQRIRAFMEHLKAPAWCYWLGSGEVSPYGLEFLSLAQESGILNLVEGESDCWTFWYHGFPALGIPGVEMTATLRSEHLAGIFKVFISQEMGAAGVNFARNMLARLKEIGYEGEKRIVSFAPHKDVSDLHCANPDPEKFKTSVQGAVDGAVDAAKGGPPKPESGFQLVGLGELLSRPEKPVDWLWQGRLAAGTVSAVVSKPKVGKSTFARNLCLSVARGEAFLGLQTKPGPCIYLAMEERVEDVTADFRALGATGEESIHIHADTSPEAGVRAVIGLIVERKPLPVLVVIDPLFRILHVKDDKAYAEMYNALGPLIDVARSTGTHLLLTHHMGKGMAKADLVDSPLGSTAIGGAVSSLIVLKRTEAYRTIGTVQRLGEALPETVLQFDPDTRRLSIGGTREEAETQTLSGDILEFLEAAAEPKTEPDITEGVEGKTKFVRKALRQLVEQRKMSREGAGKRGKPYLYRFSLSCSQHIAGTREQETQKATETRENTEGNLVPEENTGSKTAICGRLGVVKNVAEGSTFTPPAGPPPGTRLPTRPCATCGGKRFWISIYDTVACDTCHPPASPALVRGWHVLPEGAK